MKKPPYSIVLYFLKALREFQVSSMDFNHLYLDLAVKAAKIAEYKYETETRHRTSRS